MSETPKQAALRLAKQQIAAGFKPEDLYEYTDTTGKALFWRFRAKHPQTGEKFIRPLHQNGNGYQWGEPKFNGRKPIYNLHGLVQNPDVPVWVTEGENKVTALAKLGLVATTSGGSSSAKAADWAPLRGHDVRVWPDNDAPGKVYAGEVASTLLDLGVNVACVDVDRLDVPPSGDVIDWLKTHPQATGADIEALPRQEAKPNTDPKPPRFSFLSAAELCAQPLRIEWAIARALEADTFGIIWGEAGCWKTFAALSLALSLASGRDWYGHPVRTRGPVIYICGEGGGGIHRRVLAWFKHHQVDAGETPFYVLPASVPMIEDKTTELLLADITELLREREEGARPVAIFFDTLARNFGAGDENRTEDMNRWLTNAQGRVHEVFRCLSIAVHHPGHSNGERMRGAYALQGAADWAFGMFRQEGDSDVVEFKATKPPKDGIRPPAMYFRAVEVDLGVIDTDTGAPITSLVLEDCPGYCPPCADSTARMGRIQKAALDVLDDLHQEQRRNVVDRGGDPSEALVSLKRWKDAVMEKLDLSRQRFHDLKGALLDRGFELRRDVAKF